MARKKEKEVPAPEEEAVQEETQAPVEEDAPVAEEEVPAEAFAAALPTEKERRIAAAAHGSILLNILTGIGGPVLALILWLIYERESEYAGWHALQALVFQGIFLLVTLVLGGITVLLWAITAPMLRLVVGFCLVPFTLGFTLVTAAVVIGSLIYGCAGALAVLEGQDFRYRWIADIIPPLSKP